MPEQLIANASKYILPNEGVVFQSMVRWSDFAISAPACVCLASQFQSLDSLANMFLRIYEITIKIQPESSLNLLIET